MTGGRRISDKVQVLPEIHDTLASSTGLDFVLGTGVRALAQLSVCHPPQLLGIQGSFVLLTVSCHAPIILGAKDLIWSFPAAPNAL